MRIFAATSRYMQGPDLLDQLGRQAAVLGNCCVIVTDSDVERLFGARMLASFSGTQAQAALLTFPGEVTRPTIDALADRARALGANVVIGVGGGKGIDAAKGVAIELGARMVSVPTVASNDGPASASVAVYDDAHVMTEILQMKRNPDLVLVDSRAIAGAPLKFLLAGIGDAISKKFEAEACVAAGAATLFGSSPTTTGLLVADACWRTLRDRGPAAVAAVGAGQLDENVEAVIEACVLLSTLAFENGGLSVAHAIARSFPTLPRAAHTLHGAHVAYGLLVQFVLEERKQTERDELAALYKSMRLPLRLADFGLVDATPQEVRQLAENAMPSPSVRRFVRKLDADQIEQAILGVENRFSR